PTQRYLVEIWGSVLACRQIGIHENFFDLGATSLGLAAVHQRIAASLSRRLPLVALYEYPTVAALAAHLDGDGDAFAPVAAAPGASSEIAAREAGRVRLSRRRHSRTVSTPRPANDRTEHTKTKPSGEGPHVR
ncbi:acyl carrier protein, partial [Catenulispora sp. NF23]|uniref:phosphopantetheine-binding protein n=1 Tax=Catenulispora pinistramenti TaxID=2705254 RepID=UPI001BA81666